MDYLLIILITLVGIVPMLYEIAKGIFDFFNVKNLFLIYYIIVLAISGLISISSGNIDKTIGLPVDTNKVYYARALFAALLGVISFQIGYYASSNRSIKLPFLLISKWKPLNLSMLYYGFIIIGIAAFSTFLILNGGISNFLNNRESFRQSGVSGQGILMYPSTQLLAFACFLFFFSKLIIGSNNSILKYNWLKYFKLIVVFIICILPSFIFGFRSLIGISILQFLVIWNYGFKRIPILRLIPIFIFMIVGFTIYGIVREIPPGKPLSAAEMEKVVNSKPQLVFNAISRVRGTEILASVMKKLDKYHDYDYGYKAVFEAITIPIPHFLWKSKPPTSTVRFTTYFFGDNLTKSRGLKKGTQLGGISPTIVGELYWHFSWPGIIIILFLLGVVFKKIYYTLLKNLNNFNIVFVYAVFFPSFVLFAETMQSYVNGMIISSIPILFIIIIMKIKIRLKYEGLGD